MNLTANDHYENGLSLLQEKKYKAAIDCFG